MAANLAREEYYFLTYNAVYLAGYWNKTELIPLYVFMTLALGITCSCSLT
jgi:hypothetical protein